MWELKTMNSRTRHQAYRDLVNTWRACSFRRPPFIFPGDGVLLDEASKQHVRIIHGFDEFIRSKSFDTSHKEEKKALHLGLFPRPYSGGLAKASVFILMLNPGLSPLDYYAEEQRVVRESIIADIHQKKNGRYPFRLLDPNFSWLGGARYWRPRLYDHARQFMKVKAIDYNNALAMLSSSICVLQLIPYHSTTFGVPKSIRNKLASTIAITRFVKEVIVPEANRGDALVIVTRKAKSWGIHQSKNVVVYNGSESRAGYISLGSRGGKAIAKFLGI